MQREKRISKLDATTFHNLINDLSARTRLIGETKKHRLLKDLGSIIDTSTDWAEALRIFRHRNNLKQEAVANLLGVSQAYISKVENGAIAPSETLKERLLVLGRRPEHRPTLSLLKNAVRHSPGLTCLFSYQEGVVFVEECSRALAHAGPLFASHPRSGPMNFDIMGAENQANMEAISKAGAFEGRLGYIEVLWTSIATKEQKPTPYRTIFLPLRTDDGEWLLQGHIIEITQAQHDAASKAWGGSTRFFQHDEDPPYEWP